MKSRLLQYIFLGLSTMQFIIQNMDDIVISHLILFMFWTIILQLIWFHVSNNRIKKFVVIICIITGITFQWLTGVHLVLIWALITYEMVLLFEWKPIFFITLSLGAFFGVQLWLQYSQNLALMNLMVIGLISVLFMTKGQIIEFQDLQIQHYENLRQQNDNEMNQLAMKRHIALMRELYIAKERHRISRDIHDSVGHVLSTVIIQLQALAALSQQEHPQISKMSQELGEFTKKGLQEVRQIVHELKPDDMQQMSVMMKIEDMIHKFQNLTNIIVIFNKNKELWILDETQKDIMYRTIQEFLGNSAKHAQADEIRINVHYTNHSLILTLKDNGVGTNEIVPHMGLMGIEERVNTNGGKITIKSAEGEGFMMRLVLNKGGSVHESVDRR